MDHADEWCDPTWRDSHTSDASDSDASDPDTSDAHSTFSHATLRRLCAGDGLQCERMVPKQFAGLVPSECCHVPTTLLQAGLSLAVDMEATV